MVAKRKQSKSIWWIKHDDYGKEDIQAHKMKKGANGC